VTARSDGFVFSPELDGSKPWRPYHWTSAWSRLRDRIGIDPAVRLHDLRHFTATRLLDAGVPVKTVSGRLGHARPATTLNVYAHFIPATDRVAADLIGGLLAPISPVEDD
jgi:integrase